MSEIIVAAKTILSKSSYLITFFILVPLSFLLFIFLQVLTIPGNSLSFQLQILTPLNYILMIILSILVALFITMQVFIFRHAYTAQTKLLSAGKGGAIGYLGIFAAVLGTATCASCLIALFGFLGFGGIIFLLKNQMYVVGLSLIVLLVSLYFSSRKVSGVCENCRINIKPTK